MSVKYTWICIVRRRELWCATVSHTSALISVKLVLSQAPADNVRPQIQLVHHVVCLFTPQLSLVLIAPTHGGMARPSRPVWLVLRWFSRAKTVANPDTNRAWSRPTRYHRSGHLPGKPQKPGKVREFGSGQGKVRENMFFAWCASASCVIDTK